MARVSCKTQGWGVLQEPDGDVAVSKAFTISTPVYVADSGGTEVASLVTDGNGAIPGFVEEGTHVLTVDAVSYTVEAVAGDTVVALVAGGVGGLTDGSVTNAKHAANAYSQRGLLSARPAASAVVAGTTYFATDVDGGTNYRSTGSAWERVAKGVSISPEWIDVKNRASLAVDGTVDWAATINPLVAAASAKDVFYFDGLFGVAVPLLWKSGITFLGSINPVWALAGTLPAVSPTNTASGFKRLTGLTTAALHLDGTSSTKYGGRIAHLAFDGIGTAGTIDGIRMTGNVQDILVESCDIAGWSHDGVCFVPGASQPLNIRCVDVMSHGNGNMGFEGTLADFIFDLCQGHQNAVGGWYFDGAQKGSLIGCKAEWNTFSGYVTVSTAQGIRFIGCGTDRNGDNGYEFKHTGLDPVTGVGCLAYRDGRLEGTGGHTSNGCGMSLNGMSGIVDFKNFTVNVEDNDGGGGLESPKYAVKALNSNIARVEGDLWGVTGPYLDSGGNTSIDLSGLDRVGGRASVVNYPRRNGGVASKANTNTIAHGLSGAPTRYGVNATVAKHTAVVTAVSATTLTIGLHDDAGTAISVAENVSWWAER